MIIMLPLLPPYLLNLLTVIPHMPALSATNSDWLHGTVRRYSDRLRLLVRGPGRCSKLLIVLLTHMI